MPAQPSLEVPRVVIAARRNLDPVEEGRRVSGPAPYPHLDTSDDRVVYGRLVVVDE